eukprot:jgi/Chrpa1/24244/Chrysochromulina_OHIO_Genome00021019-RA
MTKEYDACYAARFGAAGANFSSTQPLHSPEEVLETAHPLLLIAFDGLRWPLIALECPRVLETAHPLLSMASDASLIAGCAVAVEIHRTDSHALQPDQWRLAIGFKVLSTAPPTARPSSCLPACVPAGAQHGALFPTAAVEDSPFGTLHLAAVEDSPF